MSVKLPTASKLNGLLQSESGHLTQALFLIGSNFAYENINGFGTRLPVFLLDLTAFSDAIIEGSWPAAT